MDHSCVWDCLKHCIITVKQLEILHYIYVSFFSIYCYKQNWKFFTFLCWIINFYTASLAKTKVTTLILPYNLILPNSFTVNHYDYKSSKGKNETGIYSSISQKIGLCKITALLGKQFIPKKVKMVVVHVTA